MLFSILGEEKSTPRLQKAWQWTVESRRNAQACKTSSRRTVTARRLRPAKSVLWRLNDDHPLTRQLREQELSNLVARLFDDPGDDDDDDDPRTGGSPNPDLAAASEKSTTMRVRGGREGRRGSRDTTDVTAAGSGASSADAFDVFARDDGGVGP